jgi:hypothetical protein
VIKRARPAKWLLAISALIIPEIQDVLLVSSLLSSRVKKIYFIARLNHRWAAVDSM